MRNPTSCPIRGVRPRVQVRGGRDGVVALVDRRAAAPGQGHEPHIRVSAVPPPYRGEGKPVRASQDHPPCFKSRTKGMCSTPTR